MFWRARTAGELSHLPPEERKKQQADLDKNLKKDRETQQAELEKQPLVKMGIELRTQFEALLTPEQLTAYKELAFQNIAHSAVDDPLMLNQIGASDQQRAALQRLEMESTESNQRFIRAMGEKMLNVLTPAQQEKLREEIDRRMSGQSLSEQTKAADPDAKAGPATSNLAFINLPGRSLLASPESRKQLGISAEQEKKLREIAVAFQADSQKFGEEKMKVSPEERERKRTESSHTLAEMIERGAPTN